MVASNLLRKSHTKDTSKKQDVELFPCDMHYERVVTVPKRDGAKLYTDVSRPVTVGEVPAILRYRLLSQNLYSWFQDPYFLLT
jgi:predicted acyl esterase